MLSLTQLATLDLAYDIRRKVFVSGTVTYIGTAPKGALSSEAKWKISKVDQTVANTTDIFWSEADQVFDDAATTVTYS